MSRARALESTDVAGELISAARRKAGQGVANRRRRGNPYPEGESVRRAAGRAERNLVDFEADIEASGTVVSAPSTNDIRNANRQLADIRRMSAQQAATRAGMTQIRSALATAKSLQNGVG